MPDMMVPVEEEDPENDEANDMGAPMLGDIAPPDTEISRNRKEDDGGCDATGHRGSSSKSLFGLFLFTLFIIRRFDRKVA